MHPQRLKWLTSRLCVIVLAPVISWAQVDLAKTKDQPTTHSTSQNAIKISLIPSREQAVAGSDFGIIARVENVSDKVVYFTPKTFSMTAPPELDPGGPRDWPAFFADIQVPGTKPEAPDYWDKYYATVIPLAPGSNVSAFWSGGFRHPGVWWYVHQFFRGLAFSPGKSTLTVVGGYWD